MANPNALVMYIKFVDELLTLPYGSNEQDGDYDGSLKPTHTTIMDGDYDVSLASGLVETYDLFETMMAYGAISSGTGTAIVQELV